MSERLEAALRAENEALARLDFPAAAALLGEKLAAARALSPALPIDAGQRLARLAEENKRLLERAIRVQGRVLDVVAGAARQAAPLAGYGARGTARPVPGAVALITRA